MMSQLTRASREWITHRPSTMSLETSVARSNISRSSTSLNRRSLIRLRRCEVNSRSQLPLPGSSSSEGYSCPAMPPILHALALILAGWVNRHQQRILDFLLEENRILRRQLGKRRLRLSDDERRRAPTSSGRRASAPDPCLSLAVPGTHRGRVRLHALPIPRWTVRIPPRFQGISADRRLRGLPPGANRGRQSARGLLCARAPPFLRGPAA